MKINNFSKLIINVTELENTVCPITHGNLLDELYHNNVVKLNCGHCFNYRAFIKSYVINNTNIYSYKKCPYCFSSISKVPLIINKRSLCDNKTNT